MLEEFLRKREGADARWYPVMEGVTACSFSLKGKTLEQPDPVVEPQRFETLFCQGGGLTLERRDGRCLRVEGGGILLLSHGQALRGVRLDGGLRGVLVAVNAPAARRSLAALCGLMGELRLDTGAVRRWMAQKEGCGLLADVPWSRAVFGALEELDGLEQGRYCVWKAVELLYLLCQRSGWLDGERPYGGEGEALGAYLEAHLEEKLTIEVLSRRFCLSPTALKLRFRQAYGQPIHTWLQRRRLERAAELLEATSMTVLQVAQAVGYDGVSQFNPAFRRQYGCTPTQYRKMSKSGGLHPLPQDGRP